ncbi:MAG TPA: pirin family protein [Dongiaceae bacterium]|nr:pirin family protein [Dongiaceae bacterium]
MINIRKSTERGRADYGWLNTCHTFSFADYYDQKHMGFRELRVINEDRVQPREGFPIHPHRDMEIITYVLEGALEHKDSMGNGSVIRPGEVQRMSAGTGITHSEFNHSESELVHFLQIWILPNQEGVKPDYEQKVFPDEEKLNNVRLIASQDGREDSVTIHQDVNLYAAIIEQNKELGYHVPAGRHVWLQVVRGSIELNGTSLDSGDGAAVSNEECLNVMGKEKAEVLLFDLA